MVSLVLSDNHGTINTAGTTTNGFYVIKFISEAYTLENNTTIEGQTIYVGELVVKAQYLFSVQKNTYWYWEQHPLHHNIIVSTRIIIHPRLDVVRITYVKYIPNGVCNRIQAKKIMQRYPICLTYAFYDYILD